jgi:glycosyltransferase involved in cell wall biosynthesis
MISVAMCTFNGSEFLPEQLQSIARQSQPVDELIVCDDGSTDTTISILQNFAQEVPFPIHIYQNQDNLGSTKNFEKCLTLCRGDLIFLCDQDDVWQPDRVKKQADYLASHPDKDAVFSDAVLVDDNTKPTGTTLWQEIEFLEAPQKKWQHGKAHEILFNGYVVTGATVALRRSCLQQLLPFPTHIPLLIHDGWIALVLSLKDRIGFINECLIFYRRHNSQQVGLGLKKDRVRLRDRFIRPREVKLAPLREKAEELQQIYLYLRNYPDTPQEKLVILNLRQRHFYRRATLPSNRLLRVAPVLRDVLLGNYQYSSKHWWLPALGDIFE